MLSYLWPMALVVVTNTLYQICAKSMPKEINPFALLTITYFVSTVASGVLYYVFAPEVPLWKEYGKLNWAPAVLGLVIVFLEAGWICAYKAGWPISTSFLVQSAFLAITLLFVGYFLYHETITWSKIAGAIICLIGLVFLNR